jgi:hypothetical protein
MFTELLIESTDPVHALNEVINLLLEDETNPDLFENLSEVSIINSLGFNGQMWSLDRLQQLSTEQLLDMAIDLLATGRCSFPE